MTINTFKPVRPPLFAGGTTPPTKIKSWLNKMERYLTLTEVAPEHHVYSAGSYLEDQADQWFTNWYRAEDNPTWEDFVEAFKEEHYPVNYDKHLRDDLRDIRQTRGIDDYIKRFKDLAAELNAPANDPIALRDHFISGLERKLRAAVDVHQPAELSEAMRIAESIGSNMEPNFSNNSRFPRYHNNRSNYQYNANSQRNYRPQTAPHTDTQRVRQPDLGYAPMDLDAIQRGPLVCHYCHEPGHPMRRCPEIPPFTPKNSKNARNQY